MPGDCETVPTNKPLISTRLLHASRVPDRESLIPVPCLHLLKFIHIIYECFSVTSGKVLKHTEVGI